MVDNRNSLVWHYTAGPRIHAIVRDGFIQPATSFVDPQERKIVWFSTNPLWEYTVSKGLLLPNGKMITLGREAMQARGIGLYRIGCCWRRRRTIGLACNDGVECARP